MFHIEKEPSEVALAVGVEMFRASGHPAGLVIKQVGNEFQVPTLIHPDAIVASEASEEAGARVIAGAIIELGTTLGKNVIVNTNDSVDHDCHIASHSHVAPGATLSGEVVLESQVYLGTGASIIQGEIGKSSVVGAGGVVIEDVPPATVVVGVPAHPK